MILIAIKDYIYMEQNSNEIKCADERPDLSIASTSDLYYAEVEHVAKKPLPAVKLEDVKYETKKRVKEDAKKSKEEAKKRTQDVLRKLG